MTFGDLLKYLRRRQRLTQLELSIAVGYSESQITRLEKNQRLPDLTAVKALFIPALQLEHEPELAKHLLELAESARQEDAPAPGIPPYKGLLYFDESDTELFFGREALTAHLVGRIIDLPMDASNRFLAVVGASGSGKSSLVRAGLAVALRRAGWETRVFSPTANPLRRLESNLNVIRTKNAERALILVDQFEEVFTLCHNEMDRILFIEKLLSSAQDQSKKITTVIVLRADFYAHCAQYPLLRHAVATEQEYIGQMSREELRRAIEEPAKRGGWEFEPGLVDIILQDIGAHGSQEPEPGALPLLSHTLLATWERRRGRVFTLDGYHASGGVHSAIAETAESVFTDQLNQEQQKLAHEVFLRLTELGEGTEDTRRRVTLNELMRQPTEAVPLRAVLNTLAEARLITLNEDSAEVAHEALIREWQRLHDWLNEDREGLKLHRHLTETVHEWVTRGRDTSELYRGARLAHAREWATKHGDRLNQSEREFLAAAIEQEHHEALEREAQREREFEVAQKLATTEKANAEEQRKSITRLRQRAVYLFIALSVAVIAAVLAGVFANRNGTLAAANASIAATAQTQAQRSATQQADAEANFLRAEAQRLAGDANNLVNSHGSSELVALLSLRSMNIQYSPQGDAALAAAAELSYPRQHFIGHANEVTSLAFSANGREVITGSLDGTARVWDAQTGKALQQFQIYNIVNPPPITWVAVSTDDRYILAMGNSLTSSSTVVTVWDTKANHEAVRISTFFTPNLAVFSQDGKYLFTGSIDPVVEVFDLQTGRSVHKYFFPAPTLSVLYVSPDGKYAITRTNLGQGTVQLWSLDKAVTKLQEFTFESVVSGAPQNVAVSPNGKFILIGYIGGSAVLWDIATGKIVQTFYGHQTEVRSVAFSPDGTRILTGSLDKTARIWNMQTGAELLRLNASAAVNSVAFSLDGQAVLTGDADGTSQLWDAHRRSDLPIFTDENVNIRGVSLSAMAFSPDGKSLATGGTDGLNLWDVGTGKLQRAFSEAGFIKYGLRFSSDGRYLISGNWSSTVITLWDAQSGEILRQFTTPDQPESLSDYLNDLAFSPNNQIIASGTGYLIYLWDKQTGKLLYNIPTFGIITRLAFSPDGQYILAAHTSGQVRLYGTNPAETVEINKLIGAAGLNGAVFSPDSRLIATASTDKLAHLWDPQSGKEIRQFKGHTDILYSVAFSPDGKYLATSSEDGTARLWEVQTGTELRRFTGHTAGVKNVTFSPDGKLIATVSDDGTVRLWHIDYHPTMEYLCSILLRDFTEAERLQYHITDRAPTCPP